MAVKKKETTIQKWRLKKWYLVVSDKIFIGAELGNVPAMEQSKLIGKKMLVNMMTLTGDPKRQSRNIEYKIVAFKDNKAIAEPTAYYISAPHIRKMVRKSKDQIDLSFKCLTKENIVVTVKPFFVTKDYTYKSVRRRLRKDAHGFIAAYAKKRDYFGLFNDIVSFKLQSNLKAVINQIFPLKSCEIRQFKLEENEDPAKIVLPVYKGLIEAVAVKKETGMYVEKAEAEKAHDEAAVGIELKEKVEKVGEKGKKQADSKKREENNAEEKSLL